MDPRIWILDGPAGTAIPVVALISSAKWLILVGFVAVCVVGLVAAFRSAKKRREALARTSAELGLQFDSQQDNTCRGGRFDRIDLMRKGRGRCTRNHFSGRIRGCSVTVFDYRYVTGSGKHRRTHRYGVVIVETELSMPEVRIRREGWFDKLAAVVGFDDVDFPGYPDFSARFHVKAKDPQAARNLLTMPVVDYLKRHEQFSWELEGNLAAMAQRGWFKPEELRAAVETAVGLVKLLPDSRGLSSLTPQSTERV